MIPYKLIDQKIFNYHHQIMNSHVEKFEQEETGDHHGKYLVQFVFQTAYEDWSSLAENHSNAKSTSS